MTKYIVRAKRTVIGRLKADDAASAIKLARLYFPDQADILGVAHWDLSLGIERNLARKTKWLSEELALAQGLIERTPETAVEQLRRKWNAGGAR